MQLIKTNAATAGHRVMVFPLVVDATDGITAETGEVSGQPQYSIDGGANWINTAATLTGGTNGSYQVQLSQSEVNQTVGTNILGRYKSANTAEARAVPIQIVAFDPHVATNLGLSDIDALVNRLTATRAGYLDNLDVPVSSRMLTDQAQGNRVVYVDPVNGSDSTGTGTKTSPWKSVSKALTDPNGARSGYWDTIGIICTSTDSFIYCDAADEGLVISQSRVKIVGPGRQFIWRRQNSSGPVITVSGRGVHFYSMRIRTHNTGSGVGVSCTGRATEFHDVFCDLAGGSAFLFSGEGRHRAYNCEFENVTGHAIEIDGSGTAHQNIIDSCVIRSTTDDAINVTNSDNTLILRNVIVGGGAWGIYIGSSADETCVTNNYLGGNNSGDINDEGVDSIINNNEQWSILTTADIPTAATIADAVWDETSTGHTDAGKAGAQLWTSITSILGKFTGITAVANWLGALAGKTTDATTRAEINATTAGASYNETTDSLEAIRDRGDAAWVTGAGTEPEGFPVTVTVTLDGSPVLDARVTLQATGTSTTYATDENGVVDDFVRPAGSYALTIPGTGSYQDYTGTVVVDVVGAVTGNTVALTAINITAPTDPLICRVYGWMKDHDGTAIEGAAVEFRIDEPPAVTTDGIYITSAETWQAVATDATGLFQIDLIRSSELGDKLWRIRSRQDGYNETVYIPDTTTALRSSLTSAIPEA